MPTLAPRLVVAALAFSALSGTLLARGPAHQEAVNGVFLAPLTPMSGLGGVKYGARLACGPVEGNCIAAATMTLTLTDGAGNVVDTQSAEMTPGEVPTWRVVVKASGLGTGTYCSSATAEYTKVDGTTGTAATSEPACADL